MIRAVVVAVVAVGCGSHVSNTTQFTAVPGAPASRAIAERAVTVRATTSVVAAGGQYLGIVVADISGPNPLLQATRHAAHEAAQRGGTHILLREAEASHTDRSIPTVNRSNGSIPGHSVQYVSAPRDEAHAVFDVFRVEADHWGLLHPQMRPIAAH